MPSNGLISRQGIVFVLIDNGSFEWVFLHLSNKKRLLLKAFFIA